MNISKVGNSIKHWFRSIDLYGQKINLSYRGDDNFKTTPGAFATLCVLSVLLAYVVYRSIILFNRINPDVSKKGLLRDLSSAHSFSPQDYGFDFAFGIGKPLDPKYGFYTAYEI